MPNIVPQLTAGADIRPCRFVSMSGAFLLRESNGNQLVIAISGEGVVTTPLSNWQDTPLAAKQGDPVHVYTAGDVCLLELGESVRNGYFLVSDQQGRGKEITLLPGTIKYYGAIALQDGSEGEKILVQVCVGVVNNPS